MKRIKLSNCNKYTLVDDEDYIRWGNIRWCFKKPGYAYREYIRNGIKTRLWLHRLVNNTPEGLHTDHINRNSLDNRKNNLRTVTRWDNMQNRKDNKSGAVGVFFVKRDKRWMAYIGFNNESHRLGYYKNKSDAIIARENAEKDIRKKTAAFIAAFEHKLKEMK